MITVGDIITLVDALEPNQFTSSQKKAWLSSLDGQIYNEIFLTHPRLTENREPPSLPYTALTQELLVPFPYGESVYNHYLQAMIASELSESARYNQEMQLYNAAYREYSNYVNRIMLPETAAENRLKF